MSDSRYAHVEAYPTHPEDQYLTIKVACEPCGSEWGWSRDTPAANDRLEHLADIHNFEAHAFRNLFNQSEDV